MPKSPPHLTYNETTTASVNNDQYRGLALESWRDTAERPDSEDPATADYEVARFDDDSTPSRDVSVFLCLLSDETVSQAWGGHCSPSAPIQTLRIGAGVLHSRVNSDGSASAAGIDHILIFVSGSKFATADRARPLCRAILNSALSSPLR